MRNIGLKIFSLVVAVLLFEFINLESNSQVLTREAPVEFTSVPDGKVIIAPLDPRAQVSVKGPSSLVSRLANTPPVFKIKVPENVEHRFLATLDRKDLGLPPYFSVLKIDPEQIEVTLDRVISKEVPITVPRIGTLGEGLSLEKISVTPETIRLSGPATEIGAVEALETSPLDLRDIEQSVNRLLTVKTPGARAEAAPRQVSVTLEVGVVQGEARHSAVPIEVRAMPGQNFTVNPAVVDIRLFGPKKAVSAVDPDALAPFVRARETLDGSPLTVMIEHLPPGVSADIVPAQVNVSPAAEGEGKEAKGRGRNNRGSKR